MYEEVIGYAIQTLYRLPVFDTDGLIHLVRAGHNEGMKVFFQKHVMERRIREHYSKIRHTRGNGGGDYSAPSLPGKDYGPLGRQENELFLPSRSWKSARPFPHLSP